MNQNVGTEYPLMGMVQIETKDIIDVEDDVHVTTSPSVTTSATVVMKHVKVKSVSGIEGDINKSPMTFHLMKQNNFNMNNFHITFIKPKIDILETAKEITVKAFITHKDLTYFTFSMVIGSISNIVPSLLYESKELKQGVGSLDGIVVSTDFGLNNKLTINTPTNSYVVHDNMVHDCLLYKRELYSHINKLKILIGVDDISSAIRIASDLMDKSNEPKLKIEGLSDLDKPTFITTKEYKDFNPLRGIDNGDVVQVPMSMKGNTLIKNICLPVVDYSGDAIQLERPNLLPLQNEVDLIDELISLSESKGYIQSDYSIKDMCSYLGVLLVKSGFETIVEYNKETSTPLADKEKDILNKTIEKLESDLKTLEAEILRRDTEHNNTVKQLNVEHVNELRKSIETQHSDLVDKVTQLQTENHSLKDTLRDTKDESSKKIQTLETQLEQQKHIAQVEMDSKLKEFEVGFETKAKALEAENTNLKQSFDLRVKQLETSVLEAKSNEHGVLIERYGEMATVMFRYKALCELLVTKKSHKRELKEIRMKEQRIDNEFNHKVEIAKMNSSIKMNEHILNRRKHKDTHMLEQRKLEHTIDVDIINNQPPVSDGVKSPYPDHIESFRGGKVVIFESTDETNTSYSIYHTEHGWLSGAGVGIDRMFYHDLHDGNVTVFGTYDDIMNHPNDNGVIKTRESVFENGKLMTTVKKASENAEVLKEVGYQLGDLFSAITNGVKNIKGKRYDW